MGSVGIGLPVIFYLLHRFFANLLFVPAPICAGLRNLYAAIFKPSDIAPGHENLVTYNMSEVIYMIK